MKHAIVMFFLLSVFGACRKQEIVAPEPVVPIQEITVVDDTLCQSVEKPFNDICLYQYKAVKLVGPRKIPAIVNQYIWSDGDTSRCKVVDKAGVCRLYVKHNNTDDYDTLEITVSECRTTRYVRITEDTSVCIHPWTAVVLDATVNDLLKHSYYWDGMLTNSPSVMVNSAGVYVVKIKTGSQYEYVAVEVKEKCDDSPIVPLYIPNSFSPNNDGVNDTWAPQAKVKLDFIEFSVRNADGIELFKSSSLNKTWDGNYKGKPCPQASYNFYISYSVQGSPKTEKLNGKLELVR